MKALRFFIQTMLLMIAIQQSSAQIGYQVSLLSSATGEPRIAETVEVKITLTNNEGTTIHEETQTETTNDFGILSLAVGNSSTFDEVDWNKLPFFISVSVDGKLVGKSQVLTVPVAEYAKRTGYLTPEILMGTWTHTQVQEEDYTISTSYTFNAEGGGSWKTLEYDKSGNYDEGSGEFKYYIDGNHIAIIYTTEDINGRGETFHYFPKIHKIIDDDGAHLSK